MYVTHYTHTHIYKDREGVSSRKLPQSTKGFRVFSAFPFAVLCPVTYWHWDLQTS